MLHRLAAEGGEILASVQIGLQPAAERVGAGLSVKQAPGLALLGVVALVEVGEHVLDGLRGAQFGVAGMQHGGAAIGFLVDQVDDAVADRHGRSLDALSVGQTVAEWLLNCRAVYPTGSLRGARRCCKVRSRSIT
ncbi:hypothetical protein FQZ97_990930 [compost metagenome]